MKGLPNIITTVLSEAVRDIEQRAMCLYGTVSVSQNTVRDGYFVYFDYIDTTSAGEPHTVRRLICYDNKGNRVECDPRFESGDKSALFWKAMVGTYTFLSINDVKNIC